MKKIFYILSLVAFVSAFSSCRGGDDFTDSIFDTNVPVVDPSKATYEFDQWLYDNFLIPYNVEIQYRFDLSASDLSYQLAPADYNRSQLLARLIRYLFFDVYTKYAGEDFMKKYGPRNFLFVGSTGVNPSSGTEILGTASGGVKITLYNVNELKPYSPGVTYSGTDLNNLNHRYFHTMHHEFSHILHQTKSYPVTFGQVTSGSYDPISWQERDSVWTHQHGYTTHYASSATYEDFVETLSGIITDTDHCWMNRIINATSMGVREGDKEDILALIDSLGIDLENPNGHWNNFKLFYNESKYNEQTGEYELVSPTRFVLDEHRLLPNTKLDSVLHAYMVVNKERTDWINQYEYKDSIEFTSFKDEFLPWVEVSTNADLTGINALLKKIDIATKWYTESWGLYIFKLRHEVRERQNNINEFLKNEVTIYDLK